MVCRLLVLKSCRGNKCDAFCCQRETDCEGPMGRCNTGSNKKHTEGDYIQSLFCSEGQIMKKLQLCDGEPTAGILDIWYLLRYANYLCLFLR